MRSGVARDATSGTRGCYEASKGTNPDVAPRGAHEGEDGTEGGACSKGVVAWHRAVPTRHRVAAPSGACPLFEIQRFVSYERRCVLHRAVPALRWLLLWHRAVPAAKRLLLVSTLGVLGALWCYLSDALVVMSGVTLLRLAEPRGTDRCP